MLLGYEEFVLGNVVVCLLDLEVSGEQLLDEDLVFAVDFLYGGTVYAVLRLAFEEEFFHFSQKFSVNLFVSRMIPVLEIADILIGGLGLPLHPSW